MWSSCSSVLLLHAGKWFQPGTMSHATSRGPYLANFGVGFRLNHARARLAPHTSQIDKEGHFWYTESGEQLLEVQICTSIPKVNVIPYPHASSASYKRNRRAMSLATRGPDLYLDPKGYVIPYPHASSASYKRNRSTSMLVRTSQTLELVSGSTAPARAWHPIQARIDEEGHFWYTESGEKVRTSQTLELVSGSTAPARDWHPIQARIDEEGHFWYTESGEKVRTSQTLELVSGSTAPARDWHPIQAKLMKKATFGIPSLASSWFPAQPSSRDWHPIQAEQKKYTAGFNNQAKNV
ncbi:hypothetical protein BJ742DRAFT_903738 [Cladochytrium replicatum]|nr:hypothetical protein BJ742DRAFT_903738 [Cladochytrium replicatum]